MINMPCIDLDLKDRKILYELDLGARQSLSSIGRKVGLSKEVVNYRINRLTELGIIKGFYARIDSSRVGLVIFRTFIKLQNILPEKEKEIVDYLISRPEVGWCVGVQGNWHLNLLFWARDNNHYLSFWKEFKAKYGNFISDYWTSVYGWFMNLPKGFLVGKKPQSFNPFISGMQQKADLDELDLKILKIISANSRTPLIDIASQLGVSDKVVSYRLKRLEKEKVISGYGISLDLEKMGYEYWKIHLNLKNYSEKRFKEMNNFCVQYPNIVYTDELIGGADFEIEGFFRGYSEVQFFMKQLREKFDDILRDYGILLYYREYKLNLFPYSESTQ